MKPPFENLKGRRVYQFILDETTGKIEDISDSFDYVKVVRCKDCKHEDDISMCPLKSVWDVMPDNFYCAMGERKTYFPKGFFSKERPLAKRETE